MMSDELSVDLMSMSELKDAVARLRADLAVERKRAKALDNKWYDDFRKVESDLAAEKERADASWNDALEAARKSVFKNLPHDQGMEVKEILESLLKGKGK